MDDGTGRDDETTHEAALADERRLLAFCDALSEFRRGRADEVEICVAGFVSAALLLVDPCGEHWLSLDGGVPFVYDRAASRIWEELCTALVDAAVSDAVEEHGLTPERVVLGPGRGDVCASVPFEAIAAMVDRALTIEFGTSWDPLTYECPVVAEAFYGLIVEEFGPVTSLQLPVYPRGNQVARILHQRVGSYLFALIE